MYPASLSVSGCKISMYNIFVICYTSVGCPISSCSSPSEFLSPTTNAFTSRRDNIYTGVRVCVINAEVMRELARCAIKRQCTRQLHLSEMRTFPPEKRAPCPSRVFLGSNGFASHLICHTVAYSEMIFLLFVPPLNGILYSL